MTRREDDGLTRVILVSADGEFREQLRSRLLPLQWHVSEAASGADALDALEESNGSDLLLLDPVLSDLMPEEFCGLARSRFPEMEILTMNTQTGHVLIGGASPSSFATRLADLLYNRNGPGMEEGEASSAAEMRNLDQKPGLRGIVGDSQVMREVYAITHMVAKRDTTVLISGESGTGKDLIAQAIHMISPRQKHHFAVVNCAAIPEALLESELFGYAKGSFTGAIQSRVGRIHAAHGGTLFLDEIGDMPLALQSKILRFVEQGEVQRIGSNDNLKVDVRVLAATNADLSSLVKQKLFREDLYYRLAVFPIRLAPLREREKDLTSLALFFAARFSPGVELTEEAIAALYHHSWPGNVRELRNVMERASILAGSALEILPKHIVL